MPKRLVLRIDTTYWDYCKQSAILVPVFSGQYVAPKRCTQGHGLDSCFRVHLAVAERLVPLLIVG
jgi:hypothetical protein